VFLLSINIWFIVVSIWFVYLLWQMNVLVEGF
jgi:hypothetical protein